MMASSDDSTMAARCRRGATARRVSVTSRETSTTPATLPSSPRIGAPEASIWISRPSPRTRAVWVGRPATTPSPRTMAARLVRQRGDDDVGPNPGAILTHPPTLVLEAAGGRRFSQLVVGPARRRGFRRVEAGEVLADDLLGRVALDLLGAGVPGEDAALRVEPDDGVILDAGNDLIEMLLGAAQTLALLPVPGQLLGRGGNPGQIPQVVQDGRTPGCLPRSSNGGHHHRGCRRAQREE